ncbi:MAG TPA: hypothetical protein VFY26_20265 [Anaerolineales bacterium]|nr:hypothetical protein [Anaerolineales bacterium]
MRSTSSALVLSRDLAIFVWSSARRAENEIRWARGKGVPDRLIDAAIEAAPGVLDQPLTQPENAERLSRALGVRIHAYAGEAGETAGNCGSLGG